MSGAGLRPYQADVISRVHAAIAGGKRRILIVLATGAGKTVIVAKIVSDAARANQRVLTLAHRRELIQQISQKYHAEGVDHGIVQAGFPSRPGESVQIASISTLHARAVRSCAMELPPADLIIVDEAHHARARTYKALLAAYPEAVIIGLTATPCRGDGRGLGNVFDVIIEGPPVAELTAMGFLVPARIYAPSQPDLTGLRVERGDYVERELAKRVDQPKLIGDIVSNFHRLGGRRRTVLFATGVQHSMHLRDEFRASGVLAEHIDGSTSSEDRDRILKRLAAGDVDLVTNAAVLTEGWDCPEVSCVILGRPTKSLGLYRQTVGRALRPSPGKPDAIIIDHAGAVFAHGFPDDPIEWTLAEDRRAENKAHGARGTYRAPSLTTCPECSAVRFQGRPCPACGWRAREKPAAVEVADGELGEVDRSRVAHIDQNPHERRNFHRQLVFIARERGYASGWAAHKFRERFGAWPQDRFVEPLMPDPAVRAWVRSRQIAYAKAMSKTAAR